MANKTVVEYTPSQRDAVCDYLHEHFGESENGFITHEINSEYVHTDVLRIDNEEGKVFGTFGMGARKMRIPVPQLEDEQRTELVMYASPDMDKDDPNLKDMREVAGYEEEIYDLNGADALRTELRYGSGKGELKGYRYIIDTKNLGGGYMEVSVIPTSESEKIEDLIDADDVKMIVDSMKFEKLK